MTKELEISEHERLIQVQGVCIACVMQFPSILNDKYFLDFDVDYFDGKSRKIWEVIVELHKEKKDIDIISIHNRLPGEEYTFTYLSGNEYYFGHHLPDMSNWKRYFDILKESRISGYLVRVLDRSKTMILNREKLTNVIPSLIQDLSGMNVLEDLSFSHSPSNVSSLSVEPERGSLFGVTNLDKSLSQLGKGKLIVVGGRPGWGKSIFAQMGVCSHSFSGYNSAVFSVEMSQAEYDRRLFSIYTSTDLNDIKDDNFDVDFCNRKLMEIYKHFWFFDSFEDLDVNSLCRNIESLNDSIKLKSVFVDYLQLLVTDSAVNRKLALSTYSRSLKKLARNTGINIYLLSQFNRSCVYEKRDPSVHTDFAECDNLSHDADVAIAIYPKGVYHRDGTFDRTQDQVDDDKFSECSFIDLQKYRDGKPERILVANDFSRSRFVSINY